MKLLKEFIQNKIHYFIDIFFILIVLTTFIKLPCYGIDPTHWASWLGPAAGIFHGRWPYLDTHCQYGLLPSLFLFLLRSVFNISTLSLALFVAFTGIIAGITAYFLIRDLTKSRWAAFFSSVALIYCYIARDVEHYFPNMGPMRAQLPIILGLFLLWQTMKNTRRSLVYSFFTGIMIIWEPVYGFFLLTAFIFSNIYKKIYKKDKQSILKIILAFCGSIIPLLIMFIIKPPKYGLLVILKNILLQYSSYSIGFAALPQILPIEGLIACFFYILVVFALYRRFSKNRFNLTDLNLFAISSVFMSIPWVLYAMSRSVIPYFYPLMWSIAPASVYFYHTCIKTKKIEKIVYLIVLILFFQLNIPKQIVNKISSDIKAVSAASTLINNIKLSISPLYATQEQKESTIFSKESENKISFNNRVYTDEDILARACRNNIPIVSNIDAFIYIQSKYLPTHRFFTISIIITKADIDEFINEISKHNVVALDTRDYLHGFNRIQDKIRIFLLKKGFKECQKYKDISIMSKGKIPLNLFNYVQ